MNSLKNIMLRGIFVSRRLAARPLQTKHLVRTFESRDEALEFYDTHTGLSIGQLEPVLSQIAFMESGSKALEGSSLFKDERFIRFLLQASSEMESCDTAHLVRYATAISKLSLPRGGCAEVSELARMIGEVAIRRLNAFSPTTLSQLAFGLGTRGVSDPQFVDFVRIESMKMMQDFSSESAITMLEAFRRIGIFSRELTDNLVERLTDEVDRFSSKDIVNCVTVFSRLGLGRGFLLRRLSRLSYENLSLFSETQLVRLAGGFARLRFTTSASVEEILCEVEKRGIKNFSASQACELLFAAAMTPYTGNSTVLDSLVKLVDRNMDSLTVTSQVDAAWALSVLDETESYASVLDRLKKGIFSIPPPSNRQLLLKALEIGCEETDNNHQWKGAMEEAEKLEMNRYESSRLHSEILALVESIKLPEREGEKITLERNARIGNLFRVDFFNPNLNLVLDIDTLSRPTALVLKHRRILSAGAFRPVALSYWDLRKMKSFEEQQEWIKSKILKALKKSAS